MTTENKTLTDEEKFERQINNGKTTDEAKKEEKDKKFDKIKNLNLNKNAKDKKDVKPVVKPILAKLANKKPVATNAQDKNKQVAKPKVNAKVNTNIQKPAVKTNDKNKISDNLKYQAALKREAEKNRQLLERVKIFEGEKTKGELSNKCKDIFEEIGITESAREDVLKVIYDNFALSNGKVIKTNGGRADIAAFLREYTKNREYLIKERRGANIRNFQETSMMNRQNNNSSEVSFSDFKNAIKNKKR